MSSEEVSYKTVSVLRFVDVVINEYTDYEPLSKIEVYFHSDYIKQCEKYNKSTIISPSLIHLEFDGPHDGTSTDYDKIIDYFNEPCILSLRVSKNKNTRQFDKLVKGSLYKLVIDASQLREFVINGKTVKFYDHWISPTDQSEFEYHKRNIRK